LTTATGPSVPPPRRSSASVKVRPRIAGTPSTSKTRPLPQNPSTYSVCAVRDRLNLLEEYAKTPPKRSARSRICSQIGYVQESFPRSVPTTASTPGSFTGRDRSIRLSRMEKIDVFAPIPSASDRIATRVTIGVALSVRKASFKSFISASRYRRRLSRRSAEARRVARTATLPFRVGRNRTRTGWSRPVLDLINNRQLPRRTPGTPGTYGTQRTLALLAPVS